MFKSMERKGFYSLCICILFISVVSYIFLTTSICILNIFNLVVGLNAVLNFPLHENLRSFKLKIEWLPFDYIMFHFSRFRNTSTLFYLHITTTVFRCVSTVCKHSGYARTIYCFFIWFFITCDDWKSGYINIFMIFN